MSELARQPDPYAWEFDPNRQQPVTQQHGALPAPEKPRTVPEAIRAACRQGIGVGGDYGAFCASLLARLEKSDQQDADPGFSKPTTASKAHDCE